MLKYILFPLGVVALIALGYWIGFMSIPTTFGDGVVPADAQVADANADKVAVLSQYVYAEARLGETPTLDISIASPDEMSKAYIQAVQNTKAEKTQNLLDGLKAKAILDKVACKVAPEKVLEPVPVEPVPDVP